MSKEDISNRPNCGIRHWINTGWPLHHTYGGCVTYLISVLCNTTTCISRNMRFNYIKTTSTLKGTFDTNMDHW